MNLGLDASLAQKYKSVSQGIRVMTENWAAKNMYCPRCGAMPLQRFTNNKPVADLYCSNCQSEYELKSKSGRMGDKIVDGSYNAMIGRITSDANPDFMFLTYEQERLEITNFVVVPKHFFVPQIIEKRKPLSETAKRAGWVGCNILLNSIPRQGRIYIVKNKEISAKKEVISKLNLSRQLEVSNLSARGWLLDILHCVNSLPGLEFTIQEMYEFEDVLSQKHPDNNNVRAKIRQQLQILRDRGFISFFRERLVQKNNRVRSKFLPRVGSIYLHRMGLSWLCFTGRILRSSFRHDFVVLLEADRRDDVADEKHGQKSFEHAHKNSVHALFCQDKNIEKR